MGRPTMLLDHTTLQHVWPLAHAAEFFIAVERDLGPMLPAWPRDLAEDFSAAIGKWREHNVDRVIVAMTSACAPDPGGKFTATVVLHWVALHPPAVPAIAGEDHVVTNAG